MNFVQQNINSTSPPPPSPGRIPPTPPPPNQLGRTPPPPPPFSNQVTRTPPVPNQLGRTAPPPPPPPGSVSPPNSYSNSFNDDSSDQNEYEEEPTVPENSLMAALMNTKLRSPQNRSSITPLAETPPQGLAATLAKAMDERRIAISEDNTSDNDDSDDWSDDDWDM